MAHEITDSDGMFTVRQPAWHGLGDVLTEYPSRQEAQQIAHPWEPVSEPVYVKEIAFDKVLDEYGNPKLNDDGGYVTEPVERYVEAEGFKANVRSDNRHILGVVGDGYQTVKNGEMWDIAEALEGEGSDVMYETGGSLRGGSQVWILMRLREPITVKGDPNGATVPYYSLQNAHDGSGSFRGQATMTRIVCANTAKAADLDAQARGTEFSFRHSKNVADRIEQARIALASWRHSVDNWTAQMEYLIGQETPPGMAHEFVRRFIPMPSEALITDRVRNNVERDWATWTEFYNGVTGEGVKDTAYGLVTASVEYLEWGRKAHNAETRFRRSFLNRDRLVTRAVELAEEASRADESLATA